MASSQRILTLDVGASKVVLAEFVAGRGTTPQLTGYGISQLGIDPENDTHSSAILVSAVRELMREHGIKPAPLYMSISGQTVFPRYVKLPPVSRDKLYQMVRYEAEQNVPFPINEVVWDYQLLSGGMEEEAHVMLVAVKVENVTRLTDCVQATHLEPRVVDAAPMALYNAVAHNYPELDGCTMVLDIGARSSNLIFIEEKRVFTRSVPVAGNAITQEIAKQFNVSFAEAEEAKQEHAQVDLGGNYEGPEDGAAQQISKIVRNVMTRLHAEVNRSINFYRSQQGGSPPARVLLTGGASIMPYTDVFFREKLGVDVEYLNPFARITVAETIDEDRIGREAHMLGEVVGLALRHDQTCPIEINLMPPDLVALKTFRRRQPYFLAAAMGLVFALLAVWGLSRREEAVLNAQLAVVTGRIEDLRGVQGKLSTATAGREEALRKVNAIVDLVGRRTQWIEMIEAIHSCLLDGVWVTGVEPQVNAAGMVTAVEISGKGFEDKLSKQSTPEAGAIDQFRDRLRVVGPFTEQSEITAVPPPAAGNHSREFKIELLLKNPLKVN
ncbi:MAG: type IV pilus assembly protein PilM [Verrucomicrobia bacterium]|nr:type IV pilus assembly protein PilM [Verrucomicrobiota bacterium]